MNRRVVLLVAVALGVLVLVAVALVLRVDGSAPAEESSRVDVPGERKKAERGADHRVGPLVVEQQGVRRVACAAACAIEERCGLRSAAECRARSCDGDVRVPTTMDWCFARSEDPTCLDVVTCSCAESCWKRGECAGDHAADEDCTRACATLVRQEPVARYRENRCVLESRCDAVAVCGAP